MSETDVAWFRRGVIGVSVLTMSNHLRRGLIALLALPVVALTPTSAPAAVRTPVAAVHIGSAQARLGSRGFGRRVPVFRTRSRYSYRPAYRRSPFHGLFRGIVRAIGIAYLVHLLFGWGAGGSPFGLLLLAALVLWLATRAGRRRRVYW
jgi:hypothetical protein